MAGTIKLGISGCGKIARVSHAPSFAAVRGVRIAAVMDTDRSRAEELAAAHAAAHAPKARIFTDYEEMLASGLDAVTLCTPNHLHCPQTLAAIEAGLHVLCEKPIAGTMEDARAMVVAAARHNRILHINQSLRYSPAYQLVARLAKSGKIGEIIHVRCLRAGGKPPNQGWSPGADWFVSAKAQGGLLLDIGIHMADLMSWIAGDITQVQGLLQTRTPGIDVPDNVRALFSFASGATGVLELSWTFPTGGGFLEIYGTEGTLRMGFGPEPVELRKPTRKGVSATFPRPAKRVKNSFQAFADAINGKAPSPSDGELGLRALAWCDAIARSHATGQAVTPAI